MQQKLSLLATIAFVLVSVIHAQVDPSLCPDGSITFSDPSWRSIPSQFEIMTEVVMDNEVVELSQAFTTQRDAIMIRAKIPGQLYWNFLTNETFGVIPVATGNQDTFMCVRQVIESTSQTSIVQRNTLFLKPSVLLGYNPRNQVNSMWGVAKIGNSTLRGIPTNVFKSCFYVDDIRATVMATYQVSDVTRFQAYLPSNISIILEIKVRVATNSGQTSSYTYNVFRYTPNPDRLEQQQALETPSGVFCQNRTSTLAVPSNFPDRFSVNNEVLVPELNHSIFSSNQFVDQSFQLTHVNVWAKNPSKSGMIHNTEIHDFGTGLNYKYNHQTGQCRVDDIRPGMGDTVAVPDHPDLLQMTDGSHMFLMDDITYQYTGKKQCRDRVWCHVWIGEKLMPNKTGYEHREWYWAFEVNGQPLQQWIPTKFILEKRNPHVFSSSESYLFNFDRNPTTTLEIDYTMANCYRALGPEEKFNLGVVSFIIDNDREYPVQKNVNYLRNVIAETLMLTLEVRSIRISNIIVDHDGKDLPVTFTLLDTPPRLGPVEFPLHEPSLTTTIARLRVMIDSNALAFSAKYGTQVVMLRARTNSLKVIYTSVDQDQNQCINRTLNRNINSEQCLNGTFNQNIETVYKSSGPLITGFWIGFIILGLLIGIVGGFFVLKRFSKQ